MPDVAGPVAAGDLGLDAGAGPPGHQPRHVEDRDRLPRADVGRRSTGPEPNADRLDRQRTIGARRRRRGRSRAPARRPRRPAAARAAPGERNIAATPSRACRAAYQARRRCGSAGRSRGVGSSAPTPACSAPGQTFAGTAYDDRVISSRGVPSTSAQPGTTTSRGQWFSTSPTSSTAEGCAAGHPVADGQRVAAPRRTTIEEASTSRRTPARGHGDQRTAVPRSLLPAYDGEGRRR